MIGYLKGNILRKSLDHIIVENQGVGYKVYTSERIYSKLSKEEMVELHICSYIREDRIDFYGFLALNDLELFEKLLGISRIGPKAALNVLATMSANEFKLAIAEGRAEDLKQVKGVGKKTAKRLILELQEKINIDNIVDDNQSVEDNNKINDAVEALVNLGYQKLDARKAVNQVCQDNDNDLTIEEIIKLALSYFS